MSLEAKALLAELKTKGASVVLRDGAPILLDPQKRLSAEDKAALKEHRTEIIDVLSGNVETIFSLSKLPERKNDGLDVTGRKDKIVRKTGKERDKVVDEWARIVCGRCSKESSGRTCTVHTPVLGGVVKIDNGWYCLPCAEVAMAEIRLEELTGKAPEAINTQSKLIELWDELERSGADAVNCRAT